MKLYRVSGSRSNRVQWMLEELGLKAEQQTLDFRAGEHKKPPYTDLHPHGLVPAFEDGDLRMIESVAICMHLADTHPEAKLAPPVGTKERAKYYQWCVYAPATLDDATVAAFFHTVVYPAEKRDPRVVEKAKGIWSHAVRLLHPVLEHERFLLGEFSTADVAVGYTASIAVRIGLLPGDDVMAAYVARLRERPAFARAYASET